MTKAKPQPKQVVAIDPAAWEGKLKLLGGSKNDAFNDMVANQAARASWTAHADEAAKHEQHLAVVAAMIGIAPRDELEGMLVAQMMAHHAAMECFRRAMIGDQPFEGRRENLNQANKLSRT
jgi:hypothetical protein